MSLKKAILFSLASWGLMALSLPPLPLGPGALVFMALWFYVLKTASKKVALLSSYLGAFLFNAVGTYWLYYVGAVVPSALVLYLGIFLNVAFFSLFILLCAWFFVKIRDIRIGKFPLIFLFPFFWAGIEVLRASGEMSFPWLSLGLVFGNSLELMQSYALFGVFGCSAIIVASNMCLITAVLKKKKKLALVPLALAASIYIGGYCVITYEESSRDNASTGDSLNVAVVQPSIHQTMKWSRAYYDSVMTQTWNLFSTLDPIDVQLIVFPETAIPDYMNGRFKESEFLENYATENNTNIVMGALSRVRSENPEEKSKVYNSAFLFGFGSPMPEYRKMHLVPFSEKIPFNGILPMLNYVDLGTGKFSTGDSLSIWQPGNFSTIICYEAIYGYILRDAKRKGAKFIVNITNDGWFMKSTAPYQHLNLVRAQAVENGIGIVRAANTGISAFIEANGKVIEKTELFEKKIIIRKIPLKTRFTPYSAIGDCVEYVLLAFSLLMVIVAKIKKPPTR